MTTLLPVQASNIITYKERSLKAKIDPELSPRSVVEQLSSAFKTPEHHTTLCLRTLTTSTLLTTRNLPHIVSSGDRLQLVPSPKIEAIDIIAALQFALDPSTPLPSSPSGRNAVPLKLSLFNLAKYAREDEFVEEFLTRGGLGFLVRLLMVGHVGGQSWRDTVVDTLATPTTRTSSEAVQTDTGSIHPGSPGPSASPLTGNSLAYALQGVDAILELESDWGGLPDEFVRRICEITATAKANNVYRPAASILLHMISAAPSCGATQSPVSPSDTAKGKRPARPFRDLPSPTPVFPLLHSDPGECASPPPKYGFGPFYFLIRQIQPSVLLAITKRIEGDDLPTAEISLRLVNGMMASALDGKRWDGTGRGFQVHANEEEEHLIKSIQDDLDECKVRLAVQRLVPLHESTDLTPSILAYQGLHLGSLVWKRSCGLDRLRTDQEKALGSVLALLGKGRRLESEGGRIADVVDSILALECLSQYVSAEYDLLDILDEEAERGDLACRIEIASQASVDILLRYYLSLSSSGNLGSDLHPFLLGFERLHHLALNAYLAIWRGSRAEPADESYVSALAYSHLAHHLSRSDCSNWFDLEERLNEDYVAIRERFNKEREGEHAIGAKGDVRVLKQDIRDDVLGFMRTQRLDRMKAGTWFSPGVLLQGTGGTKGLPADPSKPHRFALLSSDLATIYWDDFRAMPTVRPDRYSLLNTITLSSVTSLQPTTCRAVGAPLQAIPSQTSFSLLCGSQRSLLDVVARDNDSWAEWVDGLRWLFARQGVADVNDDGGGVDHEGLSKVTRRYIDGLVEAELRLRLLDIDQDDFADASTTAAIGPAPESVDFHYA